MTPLGKITTETGEQYHAQDCVSASKLRSFMREPGGPYLYYLEHVVKALPREDSTAFALGRAAHTGLFEPDKFATEFAVIPEGIYRRTATGKATYAAFLDASKGKTVLTSDDAKLAATIAGNCRQHRSAAQLIAQGQAEVTWRIKAAGLASLPPLQCRTDWFCEEGCDLSEGRPYIVDLKTAPTLSRTAYGNFFRGAKDHAYDIQFGLYMAILNALGVEVRDFFVIAAEKCLPHGVEVFRMTDQAIEAGQRKAERLLVRLNDCYRDNVWPNTEGGVQELTASTFKFGRNSAEESSYD